jgi:hypothetical protein
MADSQYGAPQSSGGGGGVGGYFADHPWAKWVALGVVVAGAYYIYKSRQNAATATAGTDTTATTSGIPGYIDPTTGLPYGAGGVNVGQVGSASTSIDDWVSSALKYLQANGVVGTDAENALYRWTNGLSLSAAQIAIINKALTGVGQAPGGPYPITPTAPGPPAQGPTLNPVTWVWNVAGPATVALGTGLLSNLGVLGKGTIKTPPPGSLLYARVRKGTTWQWIRISSLAQFVNLPAGTQIGALRGAPPVAAAA